MANDIIWAVDVEGNGANPPEIVELALSELRDFAPTGRRFHWLIRPERAISPMVTRIHGITNEDVAASPSMGDIEEAVLTWLEGATILGHNVKVDLDALTRSLDTWKPARAIDTLRLARRLRPGLKSYSLASLATEFSLSADDVPIETRGHHSAPYDAELAALLARLLLTELAPDQVEAALADADILNETQLGLSL